MEYSSEQEKLIDDGEEEGWVDTHHFAEKSGDDKVTEMKLEDTKAEDEGSDEEAVDMEEFVESGMLDDAATIGQVSHQHYLIPKLTA